MEVADGTASDRFQKAVCTPLLFSTTTPCWLVSDTYTVPVLDCTTTSYGYSRGGTVVLKTARMEPVGDSFTMRWLPPSATYTLPELSTDTP